MPATRHTARAALAGVALTALGLAAAVPVGPPPAGARRRRARMARWLLWEIPVGTAYAEELLFRGAVTPALIRGAGPVPGRIAGAVAFGLWHVGPARAAGQPVWAVLGVTCLAGAALDQIHCQTRSARVGFVLHAGINQVGAIANESCRIYRSRRGS